MITNATHRGLQGGKQAWMLGAGALAAMAVSSAGMVSASPITWGSPTTIAGPTDVSTTGTSVIAWDPGLTASGNYSFSGSAYGNINPVINGVTFSGNLPASAGIGYTGTIATINGFPPPTTNTHFWYDVTEQGVALTTPYPPSEAFATSIGASSGAYPYLLYQLPGANPLPGSGSGTGAGSSGNIGTPAFNYALALTDTSAYVQGYPPAGALNGDTLTMSMGSLTPGHLYQVQLWVAEHYGFDQTISDSAGNFGTAGSVEISALGHGAPTGAANGGYMGAYVLGTFVAGSTGVQTLAMEAGPGATNHNILINMFQLRDLGVAPTTPEPTTLGLLATAGAGLLLLGRRRKLAGGGSSASGAGG